MCEAQVLQQAYRFELDPNVAQRVLLLKSIGASRFVYNWGLELSRSEYERRGKRPSIGELEKRLVELKKRECPWLYEVSSHIGQSALKDLNKAFGRFFKGLKKQGRRAATRVSRSVASAIRRVCTGLLSRSGTSGCR